MKCRARCKAPTSSRPPRDTVVVGDEMPNMPHIELEQAGNFVVAKIEEAVLAVTGG